MEIETGSGYEAAVLSCIVLEVCTVERYKRLVRYAQRHLDQLGYDNVHIRHAEGTHRITGCGIGDLGVRRQGYAGEAIKLLIGYLSLMARV